MTLFATYSKLTVGVVRWARMLCGFTKLHVAAGEASRVGLTIAVADLARWDPDAVAESLLHTPAKGAYVVDGGAHQLWVGQCIDSGVSYGEAGARACTPLQTTVMVGAPDETYVVL